MKNKALPKEPKQRMAFLNNYRAAVLAVMAPLISFVSSAQSDSTKYSPINGYGFKYKRVAYDSTFLIPLSTSPHTPYRMGALRYKAADSTLQLWTGYQWSSIITGVGNGVDTAYAYNDSTIAIETPDQDFFVTLPGRYWDLQGVLNNGSTLTENEIITLADSLKFTSGFVIIDSLRLPALSAKTDTTTYKPLIIDASGNVSKMGGWPGAAAAPQVQNSITGDGSSGDKLRLVNDVSAPGNDYYYGTNYSGTRNWVQPDVGWYNLIKAGADNTGAIDVSTYVTAAQAAGYKNIYIPDGFFLLSSQVQLKDSVVIRGAGRGRTIIKLTSNITAFKASYALGGNKAQLQDFTIMGTYGSGGNTNQKGIVIDSAYGIIINNVSGYFIAGLGVSIANNSLIPTGNRFALGNQVTNCYFETCNEGVLLDVRAEYNTVSNTTAVDGGYGFYVSGGNNKLIGCNGTSNAYGLYLTGGANNGHGTVTGCTFNHSGTANVYATGVTLGMDIVGCEMFSGAIVLLNSNGLNFTGGTIESTSITVTTCTNTSFFGVRFSATPTWTVTGNSPLGVKLGEGSTDGLVIEDAKNNKQFEILNNNSVVRLGKSGGNTTEIDMGAPLVATGASLNPGVSISAVKARFDLGSTTGDGVQIYKTGSSGSALAVLDNSANYLLYAHPTGWVGVGNNSTRTSTEVFKVVGGAAFNLGSDATGDIFYRNSGGLFTRLGIGSSGQFLQVNTGLPSWQSTLAVANGGTGNTSLTAYALLAGGTTSTGAMQQVSGLGTSGQALVSTGSGALPTWQNISRTIDVQFTTASNSGTSETDLFTKTVAANTLTANGQTLNFEIDGEVNDNTATAQIKLYFAGNTTLNTGAINISTANTAWKIKGMVVRTSPTTAHVTYELDALGLATPKFLGYSNLTSLDFTTTNIFKVTAQAGGAGGGNGDITAHSWQVLYKPEQ